MSYLLTILSSGRDDYLARTIAAFRQHVDPVPASVFVYDDGEQTSRDVLNRVSDFCDDVRHAGGRRIGQCAAQAQCWQAAALSEHEYTFHLEDDMVILAPIDLDQFATILDGSDVVQLALVRTPWGAEIEYGGYIAMAPGWYRRRWSGDCRWLEQQRNWTNACSLHRTDLCRTFAWPTKAGCETAVGPMILQADPTAQFGLWGSGECHAAHIGVDRADGSHGY